MGDTGPCGPCSEIFFDHGDKIPGGPPGSADQDGDRFIEIWNLVFMQFEQVAPGERNSLPKPSIDTGMGLERVAAVLQGKHDNYEIDLFAALIGNIAELTGVDPHGPQFASHRVIADHLRASSFLIADGVLPSNEGRGYVLRRIMRRAMRHAQLLGAREPLMWRLVRSLVREMGQAYPELVRAEALITETLKLEETRFRKTLERGLSILDEESRALKTGDRLKGETAFTLYDTYGFPLDLTQDALRTARHRGRHRRLQRRDGEAAREGARVVVGLGRGGDRGDLVPAAREARRDRVPRLRDRDSRRRRHGAGEGRQGSRRASRPARPGAVVLNQTPFYGESGGQVGDEGVLVGEGVRFRVTDTQKKAGDLFAHVGTVEQGTLKTGAALSLEVDHARRSAIRANHSATHLLHEALRQVLGDHIAQRGSLVSPERLRFDFAHPKAISAEELRRIEDIANDVDAAERRGDDAADGGGRCAAPQAPARCSARNTATRSAWCRWAPAAATRSAGRSNCAAARM